MAEDNNHHLGIKVKDSSTSRNVGPNMIFTAPSNTSTKNATTAASVTKHQ